jgi:uncharacterized repeat protein (TIGR01451 family)
LLALLAVAPAARASATILIAPADAADAGVNDTTPVNPVGGNTATTLGGQRLAVFQKAAEIWGQALDSAVPIHILASFHGLACGTNGAVLGQTTSPNIFSSDDPTFTSGKPPTVFPKARTWYVAAQSERFAGVPVLSPSGTDTNSYQIVTSFNSSLDTSGACPGSSGWYYGFDNAHGDQFDMLTVALHEFAHGLGFDSQDDPTTGHPESGEPGIWDYFLYDDSVGLHWINMNDSQRLASVTGGALTWDGPAVKAAVPGKLDARLFLRVASTDYTQLSQAAFGGSVGTTPINGPIGVASPNNFGCTGNGSLGNLAGTIAVVDRGGPGGTPCTFVEKARNAQDAGALAVLFANNTTGLVGATGTAPDITIPAFGITQADGTSLKAAAGTPASLLRDPSRGYAGADTSARALMYSPNPFQGGSSVVHWDTSATPNLLMEPDINFDLQHDLDLTVPLFRDIGWFLVDVSISGTGPTQLTAGAQGTYTFVVTNPGPSKAPAVSLTDVTSGMTFVSNAGDCTGAFPCNLGDLNAGETRTITSVFQAGVGNNLTTAVTVASSANYNATNDTALLTINPAAPPPDAGTGGTGGSGGGCGAAPSGPMAALSVLALLGGLLARPRRRAP